MSLYTKLEKSDILKIAEQYAIPPILKYKILSGGSENTNYYLETSNEKYVLTLCERKTIEETTILTNLLAHLKKHHFSTTQIFTNTSNQAISLYQQKPILLKTFLEGQVLEEFGDFLLEKTGEAIAQLNLIPAPNYLPKQFSYGQQFFSELTLSNLEHPFMKWLKEKHTYILYNFHPQLPKALIHGDIFSSNIVVSNNGLPIIMDFEESCYYYRIFDLGMAIVGLCRKDEQIDFEKAKILIKGYQKSITLTDLEHKKLKAFIIYAATATAFWRFRQFNIIAPNEAYKNSYLAMKKVADQVFNNNFEL